ncbi:MAG: endonuclease Q family protein [Planctomycetaceae bacterium]|nr:endonuclease Q family protein [Planctomycetaceae bacterium]
MDLSSDLSPNNSQSENSNKRRYIGVRFNCCGVYLRIYINRQATAYEGRCPKCGKPISVKVGSGGTDCRFFEAY